MDNFGIEMVPMQRGKPNLRIRIPPNPYAEDEEEYTPFTDDELETPSPNMFRGSLTDFIDPPPSYIEDMVLDWLRKYPKVRVRVDEEIGVFFFRGPARELNKMTRHPFYKILSRYIFSTFKVWVITKIPI